MDCPYCNNPAKWVNNEEIYGKRYGKSYKAYYCKPCNAYVGCHNNTRKPLGIMATKEMRDWRIKVHELVDKLWKDGYWSRGKVYSKLHDFYGRHIHMGESTVELCKDIIDNFQTIFFNKPKKQIMQDDLQESNVTISAIEQAQYGYKIKDEKGLIYNVPYTKKDNTPTAACQTLQALPNNGMGLQKCFKFAVVPSKIEGRLPSRYVRIIDEPVVATPGMAGAVNAPVGNPVPNTANTPQYTPKTPQNAPQQATGNADSTIKFNMCLKECIKAWVAGKIELEDVKAKTIFFSKIDSTPTITVDDVQPNPLVDVPVEPTQYREDPR